MFFCLLYSRVRRSNEKSYYIVLVPSFVHNVKNTLCDVLLLVLGMLVLIRVEKANGLNIVFLVCF